MRNAAEAPKELRDEYRETVQTFAEKAKRRTPAKKSKRPSAAPKRKR
jgi:hypothetical protein